MGWFFSRDDEKVGPLDDQEFYELVSRGIVSPETMVWNEGMSDWQPYKNVSGASKQQSAPAPAPAATESLLDPLPQSGGLLAPLPEQNMASMGSGRSPAPGAPVGLPYAGFWVRFLARIIDSFVLGAAMAVVFVIVGMLAVGAVSRSGGSDAMVGVMLMLNVVGLFVPIIYSALFVARYGATPGKMAMGIKVVRPDGHTVSTGQAWGRAFADLLSQMTMCIGYLLAAFDSEKRALHDHVCSTRVIGKQ